MRRNLRKIIMPLVSSESIRDKIGLMLRLIKCKYLYKLNRFMPILALFNFSLIYSKVNLINNLIFSPVQGFIPHYSDIIFQVTTRHKNLKVTFIMEALAVRITPHPQASLNGTREHKVRHNF